MKALVFLFVLAGATAFAEAEPLLAKYSGGGFTPPEWVRLEVCEVYSDRVVVTKTYGSGETAFELKEEKKISLSDGIHVALKNALKEKVEEKENGLCDAPVTHIRFGAAVLFSTGACGTPRKDRVGPYSSALKDVVNTYCPKTFDHMGNR
ncbi:MAG: hypothetical protein SGJ18_10410 [Pseudomonadota bacterium]|nr:hypothetical protein [Pseudomonadota bacterium]